MKAALASWCAGHSAGMARQDPIDVMLRQCSVGVADETLMDEPMVKRVQGKVLLRGASIEDGDSTGKGVSR